MKTVLWILLTLLALLALLLLIAVIRTLLTGAKRSVWTAKSELEREGLYAEKLSRMVQRETVSHSGQTQREKFLAFHEELACLFPLVHRAMRQLKALLLPATTRQSRRARMPRSRAM